MAYGGEGRIALHVSGREHVTVAWVNRTLAALEYGYNVTAVTDLYDQGSMLDLEALLRLLQSSDGTSVDSMNVALRAFMYEDAQLQVELLQAGGSFTITFGGIARALEVLAEVFDPLARQERRERLRHAREMNRLAEESEMTTVAGERFALFNALSDPRSNFHARAEALLLPEQQKELDGLLVREFGRAVGLLQGVEVRFIEPFASQ
jgi:hypothetical protein